METLTLNCWVYGERIFPVKISSTASVWELQKVIQNENPVKFPDVDPDHLALHKVSLPYGEDDSLEGVLGNYTISRLGNCLPSVKKLSTIFMPLPADDQLHLIIMSRRRLVPFECWIRGADPASSFGVHISMYARVDNLKPVISAKYGEDHDEVAPCRFTPYKIPIDDDGKLHEILGTPGSGQLLLGDKFLYKIFDDVPFSRMPRVVVEICDDPILKFLSLTYHHHIGNGDPITTARDAFLKSTSKDKPSNTDAPSAFRTRQLDSKRCKSIPCGRPREYEETIPTTLLHPVFGQFVDDCQTIEVTADDNEFIESLANAMSALYKYESVRVSTIYKAFQNYNIHFFASETKTMGYMTDADISVNGHRYVIARFENETGSTSTEPYFQAIGSYLESTRESALKFRRSPLPCLLLTIFGPYIMFAGAAWNLRPTAQILSTPIAFHFHSTDIHNQLTVARHMAAFRKATERLKEYYENLQGTPLSTSTLVPPQIFPHPTSYRSLHDNTLKNFQYMIELNLGKLIFSGRIGTPGEDVRICIKFVRTYSPDAHKFLASLGCAPALRGFEEIAGGWFMVVMDMLPDDFEMLNAHRKPFPSSVFADIAAKLRLFHEAGYVHGDIRDANTMVSKSDETRFMIIDFDWAGRTKEARYPIRVNYTDIVRPPGARDGKEILPEHDLEMLDHMARLYSKD